jgi:DNA-directed RNA polymerase subunit RPC12/RpoP
MANNKELRCPHCNSDEIGNIEPTSSDGYSSLILYGHENEHYGAASIRVCMQCGIVFIKPPKKREED